MPNKRLLICSDCPSAYYRTVCYETKHFCRMGHYGYVTSLPVDGECPDFPKPEDNVPGEVFESAKEIVRRPAIPQEEELVEL